MATLTRLASTLTAKYFPSQSLTDAFYMDGRLCGKRETRQADITIDKDERGFFFSVFTHPSIKGLEPGTLPPYEPQLRDLCNNVKFGHKDIDSLIEKFMSTAVDVTGMMKLADSEARTPYFSGIIVRDSEAFAVTIGNGLAFLYRDDTLFPLTDAGIPMEPIDAYGNRVGDFQYYCSSKTANALWSNFFTLTPDDCVILCNKAVYDALGQREILRILTDAEDQCDAAGVVITQASARMPNTPMQFSISFVESVTADQKKGLFGFRKKSKEEDTSDMSIKSTFEGGEVGKAAEAAADAGFANFGAPEIPEPPVTNQEASADNGIVVPEKVESSDVTLEFPEEKKEETTEIPPEEIMKNLFGQMQESSKADTAAKEAAAAAVVAGDSLFVASDTKSEDSASAEKEPEEEKEPEMLKISETELVLDEDDNEPTKPFVSTEGTVLTGAAATSVLAAAMSAKKDEDKEEEPEEITEIKFETPTEPEEPKVSEDGHDIVFSAGVLNTDFDTTPKDSSAASETFDPYGVGSTEELQNTPPLVFGDDKSAAPSVEEPSEELSEIPVPEFDIDNPKPELKEDDRLNVDFPPAENLNPEEETKEEEKSSGSSDDGFVLPFANGAETIDDTPAPKADDVPDMPVYETNGFDTPVTAINSEEPIDKQAGAYSYGDYDNSDLIDENIPTQPFGAETFSKNDQTVYTNYGDTEPAAATYQDPMAGQQYPQQPVADPYAQPAADPYSQPDAGYARPQPQPQPQPDGGYSSFTPEQEGVQASASSTTTDEDWIMGLLGETGDENYTGTTDANGAQPASQTQYTPAGYDTGDQGISHKSGSAPRAAASESGGGNGGKRKMKLNRNGYVFLGFVALVIICLIVMISLIAKSCSKEDETVVSSDSSTTTSSPLVTDTEVTTTTVADASAPIGRFVFSDYTGYRSWWDLFNTVYNIQIENESDERIKIIIEYNNLDPETYTTPNSGDSLLLPPAGVLDGTITNTFSAGAAATGETTAETTASSDASSTDTSESVEGEIVVQDGDAAA